MDTTSDPWTLKTRPRSQPNLKYLQRYFHFASHRYFFRPASRRPPRRFAYEYNYPRLLARFLDILSVPCLSPAAGRLFLARLPRICSARQLPSSGLETRPDLSNAHFLFNVQILSSSQKPSARAPHPCFRAATRSASTAARQPVVSAALDFQAATRYVMSVAFSSSPGA